MGPKRLGTYDGKWHLSEGAFDCLENSFFKKIIFKIIFIRIR